jgi:hypothetical protein
VRPDPIPGEGDAARYREGEGESCGAALGAAARPGVTEVRQQSPLKQRRLLAPRAALVARRSEELVQARGLYHLLLLA